MTDCDVLVVGGGPAGSTISALLAEKGWRVTHARASLRLWWLRVSNPRIVFTGGTTPVDTA